MYEWKDGRMDRRLEIHPCVLQDIGPLVPLPKNEMYTEMDERKKDGSWTFFSEFYSISELSALKEETDDIGTSVASNEHSINTNKNSIDTIKTSIDTNKNSTCQIYNIMTKKTVSSQLKSIASHSLLKNIYPDSDMK